MSNNLENNNSYKPKLYRITGCLGILALQGVIRIKQFCSEELWKWREGGVNPI